MENDYSQNPYYIVLDAVGNPIPREGGTEANPFRFYSLIDACRFAEKEKKNQDAVAVAELKVLDRQESGI